MTIVFNDEAVLLLSRMMKNQNLWH